MCLALAVHCAKALCSWTQHLNCLWAFHDRGQRVHRDMNLLLNTAQNAFIISLMAPLIKMFRDADSGSIEMAACSYLQCKWLAVWTTAQALLVARLNAMYRYRLSLPSLRPHWQASTHIPLTCIPFMPECIYIIFQSSVSTPQKTQRRISKQQN